MNNNKITGKKLILTGKTFSGDVNINTAATNSIKNKKTSSSSGQNKLSKRHIKKQKKSTPKPNKYRKPPTKKGKTSINEMYRMLNMLRNMKPGEMISINSTVKGDCTIKGMNKVTSIGDSVGKTSLIQAEEVNIANTTHKGPSLISAKEVNLVNNSFGENSYIQAAEVNSAFNTHEGNSLINANNVTQVNDRIEKDLFVKASKVSHINTTVEGNIYYEHKKEE